MRLIILFLVFLFLSLQLEAQLNMVTKKMQVSLSSINDVAIIALDGNDHYVSLAFKWNHSNIKLYYRHRDNTDKYSQWQPLIEDVHIKEELTGKQNIALVILGLYASGVEIKCGSKFSGHKVNVELHATYDNLGREIRSEPEVTNNRNGCTCEEVPYINREGWGCPWGDDSPNFIPDYSQISHMVIHHQAGNAPEPYDAVVRAIWNYHVNTNGWSDIGYNWLIAPNGKTYKGRAWLNGDQNVRGAHTCACNSNKMGICLLGDFTNAVPPTDQYEGLKDFLVWKACELSINPELVDEVGRIINNDCVVSQLANITSHKEVCGANYTECPGNAFYPMMPTLKEETINQYLSCSDTLSTFIVDEVTEVNKLKIVTETTCIRIESDYQDIFINNLEIYSNFGQRMYQNNHYQFECISTTGFSRGFYFVTGSYNGIHFCKKLIIAN